MTTNQLTWAAAARGCRAGIEGDNNDTYSLGKWRTGVDVPSHPSAEAYGLWAGTEGDNDNAHSLAERMTGVELPPLQSGT
jgi:hypothetical protein